jgi:uncharacterized protein
MASSTGYALVTGASGGIGLEIAQRLARRRMALVLVARSREKLEEIAVQLRESGSPEVVVLPADLSTESGAGALLAQVAARGLEIEALVNNAGFGVSGAFAQQDERELLAMVQVNITALMLLTRRLLPAMVARKRGHVLNVASTAGFQPGPGMATYYATKAFVVSFSEGIRRELAGTGVSVTTLCPGPTETGFQDRAGVGSSLLFRPGNMMDAGSVADAAVAHLADGGLVIPGFTNKLLIQLLRISPRRAVIELINQLNKARAA